MLLVLMSRVDAEQKNRFNLLQPEFRQPGLTHLQSLDQQIAERIDLGWARNPCTVTVQWIGEAFRWGREFHLGLGKWYSNFLS